jgi:hypothetical protein
MARHSEQLIAIDELSARIDTPITKIVASAADRNIHAYIDGTDALPLSVAQRIAKEVRAEQATLDRQYIAQFEAGEKVVEDQIAAARRRGAERQPRVLRGVQVSLPGDPENDWSD